MKSFQFAPATSRIRRFLSLIPTRIGDAPRIYALGGYAVLFALAALIAAGIPFVSANAYQSTQTATPTLEICRSTSTPSATSRGREVSFVTPDFTNTPTVTPTLCYGATATATNTLTVDEKFTATHNAIGLTATWRNRDRTQIATSVPVVGTRSPQSTRAPGATQPPAPTRTSAPKPTARPPTTNPVPPGATAICNDGTYSFAQHRSGACSHHGGVRQWLVNLPP